MEVQIDRVQLKKEAKKLLDEKIANLVFFNLCFTLLSVLIVLSVYAFCSLLKIDTSEILKNISISAIFPDAAAKLNETQMALMALIDIFSDSVYTFNEPILLIDICYYIIIAIVYFGICILINALIYPYLVCLMNISITIVNKDKITFPNFFSPFSKLRYFLEYTIAGIQTTFFTGLWSLVLIIPGIVAVYRYSFVPLILATSNELTAGEAIEISKNLTDGNKGKLFALDLSFIGWGLFKLIACTGLWIYFINNQLGSDYRIGTLFATIVFFLISFFVDGYYQIVRALYFKKIAEEHDKKVKQTESVTIEQESIVVQPTEDNAE